MEYARESVEGVAGHGRDKLRACVGKATSTKSRDEVEHCVSDEYLS